MKIHTLRPCVHLILSVFKGKSVSLSHSRWRFTRVMPFLAERTLKPARLLLALSLIFPQTEVLVAQERYPVVVMPGTPSIWSMEQAHYLLGRLRLNNDALRTKSPNGDDLDPNLTNGLRLDALRSALGVAAELDNIKGAQNRQTLTREKENTARQPRLSAEADALHAEVKENETQIAKLQGKEKKVTDLIAITPTARTAAETEALKVDLAEVKGNITELQNQNVVKKARIAELEKQIDLSGLRTTDPPDISKMPALGKVLEDSTKTLLKKTVDGFDRPKLHSTIVLDNFLQMQYEILAKQLAMLRDEVGAGQRVIFLEMPTSINAAGRKLIGDGGEDKLAQSWWKVNRITRRYKIEDSPCFVGEARYERFARAGNIDGPARVTATGTTLTRKTEPAEPNATNHPDPGPDPDLTKLLVSIQVKAQQLMDQHAATKKLHDDFLLSVRDLTAVTSHDEANRLTELARILGTKLETQRRLLDDLRARYISRISPTPPKDYAQQRARVRELEAPCRDEQNRHAQVAAAVRSLSSDIKEALGKKDLAASEKIRLETLRDETIPAVRDVLDDRLTDLLAIHQARIYEYFGGPEFISSAFVSEIASSDSISQSGRESGQLRAVELIPRQTALNVNSTHAMERNSALSFAWKALFGFGLKVDYQRQREQYDQFIQQEAFASGFGKGQAIFGWTFGPLPGTRVLNSGTRNTYAALVVPDDASALELEGMGCAFNYKAAPPASYTSAISGPYHCSAEKLHSLVGIPDQDNSGGFWLNAIDYAQAEAGTRTIVIVRGSYISPQTTVLVNGRRLPQILGLGKPPQHMDTNSTDDATEGVITGSFEFVDQQQIAMNLSIPKGYSGEFPTIALVSPSRAAIINTIRIPINGRWRTLNDVRILPDLPNPKLSLSSVRTYGQNGSKIRVQLSGSLLNTATKVMLNGVDCDAPGPINAGLVQVECMPSDLVKWGFLAISPDKVNPAKSQSALLEIDNPLLLAISTFDRKDAAVRFDDRTLEPTFVSGDLIGTGFTPHVQIKGTSNRIRVVYKSPTSLYCEIDNPVASGTTMVIKDAVTGKEASIEIPTPPRKKAETETKEGVTTVTTIQSEKKIVKK